MCDLIVGLVVPTPSRFKWMDFLHGYLEWSAALIIPNPKPIKENIAAIVKPFQFWVIYYANSNYAVAAFSHLNNMSDILIKVWIDLGLAIFSTLLALYFINRLLKYRWAVGSSSTRTQLNWSQLAKYTFRTIINQGLFFFHIIPPQYTNN